MDPNTQPSSLLPPPPTQMRAMTGQRHTTCPQVVLPPPGVSWRGLTCQLLSLTTLHPPTKVHEQTDIMTGQVASAHFSWSRTVNGAYCAPTSHSTT